MSHKSARLIALGVLAGLLLPSMPVYAVETFKISGYGGGHQIWFEAEEFTERSPDDETYFRVVDQADAFGQAITRAGGAGGRISWTFDISTAGGTGGTWYFWARNINPSNSSDFMVVEGHPGDQIPGGPPYPGTSSAAEFANSQRVFEENMGPPWVWGVANHEEAHTKELQDGENTMHIYHRQGNDSVFWDVFVWADDPSYVPTDDDYRNATVVLPGNAYAPIPANGATDAPRDLVLRWTAGDVAAPINGHKLYFSDNVDDITNEVGAITLTPASYAVPQRLEFDKTYYWRVDEVTSDGTVLKGGLWSFTTELFAYPIQNITATASSSAVDKGPENAVNGSGLDSTGLLHGNQGAGTMWLSDVAGPQPAWILFEFDGVYKLNEMFVWNSNESLEPVIGLGFKEVVIEYSSDGVDFTTLGATHEFARADGSAAYAHNTTIDMGGVGAKFVRLTANSNWGGLLAQFGLAEVRFFSIPVKASEPSPASGTFDVPLDLDLLWRPGREADKHDVYFSEDFTAVTEGTAPMTTVADATEGPLSLDLGKTYFWRVDEVNDAETPSIWPGQVWNFTTIGSLVVDDFESYTDNDQANEAIWQHWIDGFGVPTNGSQVGHLMPPYAEKTIILGGSQSMPLTYSNTAGATNSEATLTLTSQKDWTIRGVGELSIWFRGYPASVGGFVEGPAGTFTVTAEGADIWNQADEFHYVYKQLTGAGSIIARIDSVEHTDVWAKAGVMIRETLDAGSVFAAAYITPTNADGTPTQGCRFQGRTATDGSATSDTSVATAEQMAIVAPYWVKMERDVAGNFRASYSANGATWTPMVWRPAVSMGSTVYIGLALTSHNAGVTGQAVFSGVQTEGNVTGQWQSQDIGLLSNSTESMYVAVASGNGASGVVAHDDPAATQIDTWTEWRINLQTFADQGVNLTDVTSISLGVGDKDNPQSGGTGIVYFDDIALFPERAAPLPKQANIVFEAEAADVIGSSWRTYRDVASSGGTHMGSNEGDGSHGNVAPGADWVLSYSFTAEAGVYKIVASVIAPNINDDSFWVRIVDAQSQTHEHPGQLGTGWVRFNDIGPGSQWVWDEVHSSDHNGEVVNWTLGAGEHRLEIAKREDGAMIDAILVTDDLALDPATLP
ncbi:MAG: discoidin domain-containing protein [Planctomycetota bacterium]